MGITDGKLLFFLGVSEENMDNKISTKEYNNRTFYDCFNNPFTADFGILALNLPPITIGDRPSSQKRARYTQIWFHIPSMLPLKTLLVIWPPLLIFHNSLSYLLIIRTIAMPWRNMSPTMAGCKEDTALGNTMKNICYKNTRFYCSMWSDKDKKMY